MTVEQLRTILATGDFHHATYRTEMARGLHIYSKSNARGWGFGYAGAFSEYDPLPLAYAHHLVRKFGVYEGAYK